MSGWKDLKFTLRPEISEALDKLGFSKPTPVQAATIPLFAQNKDVVVEAVTGSGKTLAFLIPILEILRRKNGKGSVKIYEIQALILSPTRELAKQIGEALDPFLEAFQLKKFVSVGGSDPSEDVARFKAEGGNIVIGTPGRIEDLCQKYPEVMAMKGLEALVLDEADRLLDMGFEKSVNSIISKLPKQRRTGLFSATMTNAVNELIRAGLRNPVRVTVKVESKINQSEQKIPDSLKIYYHTTTYEDRLAFLIDYLSGHASKTAGKAIVYFGTCACVDYFAKACKELCRILKRRLNILALHGRMEHKRRENVYKEFSATDGAVLFCTDLAARGLDFPDIELVVQFDAPQDPASFVHRCGRTARVGRDGTALLLLDPKEEAFIDFLHGKMVPIEKLDFAGQSLISQQIISTLIKGNSEDRELYEKSLRAFVSYMRFYQEHHAKFIFSFKDLDIGGIARSFGLLHLPKMPELKLFKDIIFEPIKNVKTEEIRFKDKAREKQRQANIKKRALQPAKEVEERSRRVENTPWSNKQAQKEKRAERKEKKSRKRVAIENSKAAQKEHDEDDDDIEDDYKALMREKRLAKKLNLGKISQSDLESEASCEAEED